MTDIKRKIREAMVVRREEVNERLLEKIKGYVSFSEGGETHFEKDLAPLNQRERFLFYLIAKWFSHQGELISSDAASYDELVDFFQVSRGTVQGRLSELSRQGIVEKVSSGSYRIKYVKIENILNSIIRKLAE